MDTTPVWLKPNPLGKRTPLRKDESVDVIVVGGGITGITAAYLLMKAGKRVALLERGRLAQVDTGHTTAHLTWVTDLRLHLLRERFGEDDARAVCDAGRAGMEQIAQIVRDEKISCDLSYCPGFLHLPFTADDCPKEKDRLKEDAAAATELGFDAAYVDSVPLFGTPGVRFPNQAKFHPLRYLAGLVDLLVANGCIVCEETDVEEVSDEVVSVKANGHTVIGNYIVLATHNPLMGRTGLVSAALFQTKLALYTSYAVGAKLPAGAFAEALYWDTADPYHFLRIDRGEGFDYAIYGGEDHKTGQAEDYSQRFERLEAGLKRLAPEASVDRRWSGQVIETNDGLPYIGETASRQFVATGYSGNGMTFGTVAAMMACDAVMGKVCPWVPLFDPHRKKLRGGTFDYLRENIDYPYYMLKDRLAKAEEVSVRSLKRGEGKILRIEGERVAAYRDDYGRVVKLSPVCTHMGCLVRWNGSERTWDCPCHGSRFQATGEVLSGPAESPLEKIGEGETKESKPAHREVSARR